MNAVPSPRRAGYRPHLGAPAVPRAAELRARRRL